MFSYFYHLTFYVEERLAILIVRDCVSESLVSCLTPMPCVGDQEYFLLAIFPRSQRF